MYLYEECNGSFRIELVTCVFTHIPTMTSLIDEKKPVPLEKANDGLPNPEYEDIAIHPQRTSDPLDLLNWSWARKHSILAIVMLK